MDPKQALSTLGWTSSLIILLTAALFDPTRVAPGLYLLGPNDSLALLGLTSGIVVSYGLNILLTILAILYLLTTMIVRTISDQEFIKGDFNNSITVNDSFLSSRVPIILYAFVFATGFYYTGIVGVLAVVMSRHLVKIVKQRSEHLSVNDDLP